MPKLECFPTDARPPDIVPGRPQRKWMEMFDDRHPYRCLPLTMANCTGWEILCPIGFTAERRMLTNPTSRPETLSRYTRVAFPISPIPSPSPIASVKGLSDATV